MSEPENKNAGVAKGIYPIVKNMAIAFEFKPGESINEVDLARRLGASRTPLREALNRLVAEGFLVMQQGRGISRAGRMFSPEDHDAKPQYGDVQNAEKH